VRASSMHSCNGARPLLPATTSQHPSEPQRPTLRAATRYAVVAAAAAAVAVAAALHAARQDEIGPVLGLYRARDLAV